VQKSMRQGVVFGKHSHVLSPTAPVVTPRLQPKPLCARKLPLSIKRSSTESALSAAC